VVEKIHADNISMGIIIISNSLMFLFMHYLRLILMPG